MGALDLLMFFYFLVNRHWRLRKAARAGVAFGSLDVAICGVHGSVYQSQGDVSCESAVDVEVLESSILGVLVCYSYSRRPNVRLTPDASGWRIVCAHTRAFGRESILCRRADESKDFV